MPLSSMTVTTTIKQNNKIKKRNSSKMIDDEVVNVCKQTILVAINKIILGKVFI